MTQQVGTRLARAVHDLVAISLRDGHLGRLDPAEGASGLEAKVLDKFATGDARGALELLLGQTNTLRGRVAVKDLAESALLSLGVDIHRTRAAIQSSLVALAKGGDTVSVTELASPRSSPIRDAFRGLSFPLDDASRRTVRIHALTQARVEASLARALAAPERLDALRAVEGRLKLSETSDGVLSGLLTAYRECEAWQDLTRLFEAAPPGFKKLPSTRREYALALNQLGRGDEAGGILAGLVRTGDRSTVTFGLQGRVFKDRYDRALAAGNTEAARGFLDAAIVAYGAGFAAEMGDLYPAVALPVLLEEKGTPAAKSEARAVATVLLYNAERRSQFGQKDYWDSATALEMSCILRDAPRMKRWLGETLAAAAEPWMRESTAKNLQRLAKARGGSPEIQAAIDALRGPLPAATARPPAPIARRDADDHGERAMAALLDNTYRFGGRSPKWLSGNYAYAGIAHDVRVTPSDVTYFDRVMRAAGIDRIADPLEASRAMDTLVRKHFGTDTLEDLQSPDHQYYDRVMPGLAKLMAASSANSQTNVSADWINGLADCRQHAPCKLMLWEAWKRARTNELLGGIFAAEQTGDKAQGETLRAKLDALTPWELRILDAQVVDGTSGKLHEEHTMTILVRRGARQQDGVLAVADEVRLADAFYHHKYPLSDGKVEAHIEKGQLRLEIPGNEVDLIPAVYSKDRASRSIDYGQLAFRGQAVATPGWEHSVPVEGLDLSAVHDQVDAEVRAAATPA